VRHGLLQSETGMEEI